MIHQSEDQNTGMSERLAKEVLLLALYCRWTEQDILSMPSYRRESYVRIITDLFSGSIDEALRADPVQRHEAVRRLTSLSERS
jgi:hypothetical protein